LTFIIVVSFLHRIGNPEDKLYGWAQYEADRATAAQSMKKNGCKDKLITVAGDASMIAFVYGANTTDLARAKQELFFFEGLQGEFSPCAFH
jgi:cobyrinic acid a,c-diamide synthase